MSAPVTRGAGSLLRIFRWPLLLGAASVLGLVGALIGDGAWDVLSWFFLGSLVVAMTSLVLRPDRGSER